MSLTTAPTAATAARRLGWIVLLASLALLPACRRHASQVGAVAKPKEIPPAPLPGGKLNPCGLLMPQDADSVLGGAVRQADLKTKLHATLPTGVVSTAITECSYSTVSVSPLKSLSLLVIQTASGDQAESAFQKMKDGVRASAGVDPDDLSLGDKAYWAGGHDRKLVMRKGEKLLVIEASQGLEKEQRELSSEAAKKVLARLS